MTSSKQQCRVVESALLQLATGFTYHQQEVQKLKKSTFDAGKKAEEFETLEVVSVEKFMAPNIEAALLWLQTFAPQRWNAGSGVGSRVEIIDDIAATQHALQPDGDS